MIVWQYIVCTVCGSVAVFVASESFYPQPPVSEHVTGEGFLYALLAPALGLSIAPPQASPCLACRSPDLNAESHVTSRVLTLLFNRGFWLGNGSDTLSTKVYSIYERTAVSFQVCPLSKNFKCP